MLRHSAFEFGMLPTLMNNVNGGFPMNVAVSEQVVSFATVLFSFIKNPLRFERIAVSSSYLRIAGVCVSTS